MEAYGFQGTEEDQITSMNIIKTILTNEKFCSGVEVIVHIICSAAVKISVESVVESLVSHENHFHSSRQMEEDNALQEMSIAENGPLLHQADPILRRAMSKYWGGPWHFVRRTDDIRDYTGGSSKVVGKLMDRQSKLPFMDQ